MAVREKKGREGSAIYFFVFTLALLGGTSAQRLLDPIPRQCRNLGDPEESSEAISPVRMNEYPAGGILMTLAQIPADIKGTFEFYLCPEEGNSQQEECLIRIPLQLADGSGTQFKMENIEKTDKYQIPLMLPDEITCDDCVLQWRVVREDCKTASDCSLMDDTFCADINIREVKENDKRFFHLLLGALFGKLT
ncbi:uncharacterized protein LOC122261273 [Penaeus japonicus]|uniref:uncharacterized protein LOC122261273 n=1 Tax=Penaeus japonicus TaxID=27405 RepID=UPI001C70B295|nr:uncharacterized protein LOC122261273 [Penaeus japonicus]